MSEKSNNERIRRIAKKIKIINEYGGKCAFCDDDRHYCLTFHHINSEKEYRISNLLPGRFSKINKELNNCAMLCANCHAKYHLSSTNIKEKN